MSFEKWEQEIVDSYPEVFSEFRDRGYGFECGEGWNGIISEFCRRISELDKPVKIVWMKEKFGTLDINTEPCYTKSVKLDDMSFREGSYTYMTWAELEDIIEWVTNASEETCESCGEPGELRKVNWMKVRCDSCYEPKTN